MLTQKLSKGFKSWKAMAEANAEKIKGFNGKILYAGSHAEDDNSMVVIMHYESKDVLLAFKNDQQITKARQEAGALTHTTVMTILSDDALMDFPG
jgi:heme-degrading monooxygenase HmoA